MLTPVPESEVSSQWIFSRLASNANDRSMRIVDLPGLLNASSNVLRTFGGQPWWRGHGSQKWKLVPKVHREKLGDVYEANIANKFSQRAPTRHSRCPPLAT